jgi:hypothetical protein
MAEEAKEPVKQEGDFKIKSKPKSKKPKQLAALEKEVAKIDLSKPEAQGEVQPAVAKMDLTKEPEKVVEEKPVVEIKEEVKEETPIQVIEEITEKVKETPIQEKTPLIKTPKLPENVEKLVKFMDETGGTVSDYVELNKDYSSLDDNQVLKEFYKKTKPHLDNDDIGLLLEDYQFDEDLDEAKDIRRKKLAYKEAVAQAKNDLTKMKDQYYAEIKNRPGANPEQAKATDFFNRYNKQQETIKQSQELFKQRTNDLFGSEFKGFDYSVGDKNFRYKLKDPARVAETQSNIENFVNKFIDKEGNISDAAGYHKALYAAMNADKLASHFYEQGKADGVKAIVKQSKNPATDTPRQVAGGDVFVGGMKVKSISGSDSSKLKIKKRTFNN